MNVYALLNNGTGGLDWAGLPLLVGWMGIHDVEALMHRLAVIRLHRPPKEGTE